MKYFVEYAGPYMNPLRNLIHVYQTGLHPKIHVEISD